jgi:ABC-type sugar transport system ATPase subunit
VREPKAFLFDEPLSNLDAKLRVEMRTELLKLHRSLGATMLYVTHDQVEAMTMGRRIAVLHQGQLRQVGTPAEVYGRPADAFVARFIGSPGMNLVPGAADPRRKRVAICGSLRIRAPLAVPDHVQVGVRPEHVSLGDPGQGSGAALVRMVEPLGSETLVHLDAAGATLVAKIPGIAALKPGDRVGVRVEPHHVHLFDTTGARVL